MDFPWSLPIGIAFWAKNTDEEDGAVLLPVFPESLPLVVSVLPPSSWSEEDAAAAPAKFCRIDFRVRTGS